MKKPLGKDKKITHIGMNEPMIEIKKIRSAIADYILSEGCSCCRSPDHDHHQSLIAELLDVKKYRDSSGYNFQRYKTK